MIFVIILAFPTLLFVALSRGPSLAADSGNAVVNEAPPSAVGHGQESADIELPHELPTPDEAQQKKTLTEKAKEVVADLVTGTRHSVYDFKTKLLDGKDATSYPEDRREMEKCGINYIYQSVVIQKNIITAQDSSSSRDFANAIVNFCLK